MKREPKMPDVTQVMKWEAGEMSEEEAVDFFQDLIDTGAAWQLQGMYGRAAKAYIDAGLCVPYRHKGDA